MVSVPIHDNSTEEPHVNVPFDVGACRASDAAPANGSAVIPAASPSAQLGLNTMVGSNRVASQAQLPSGPRLIPKSMASPAGTVVVTAISCELNRGRFCEASNR